MTDGETLSRAGTGPPARAVGCCARVLDAPRGCPRRGGARSGPMRHPAFAREKAGTTRPNASFFAFCARGAGAGRGAAAALLVDFESGRTLLVPRLRRARSLWPGALPSRRRVRSPYRDRPRETTHARASFPRVRSDSLPAGQPSRVRGGPGVPPREALHATEREPSRERAFAVRGRPLRRPRFPGRRKVCRPKKKIPMRYSLRILKACDAQKMKRFARGERKPHWVFIARTRPPRRDDEQEADPAQEEREGA